MNKQPSGTVPTYLTVDQLSVYLNVSLSTIYKWTHKKQIPHFKPSGAVLFKRDEIDQWVESNRILTHASTY